MSFVLLIGLMALPTFAVKRGGADYALRTTAGSQVVSLHSIDPLRNAVAAGGLNRIDYTTQTRLFQQFP